MVATHYGDYISTYAPVLWGLKTGTGYRMTANGIVLIFQTVLHPLQSALSGMFDTKAGAPRETEKTR